MTGNGQYGLGVDLGTTYTAAATWRDGRAEALPLGRRAHTVPSVLYLREDGVLLVGEAAVLRSAVDPERTAREFKRRFGDPTPMFLGDREITPEELAGQLLRWVVEHATELQGGPPTHVTLTHPASWGAHRTDLLVKSAEQAGLTDVGLLAEPVAAAAYHSSTERLEPGGVLAIYDLGGGTFDAAVVRKTPGGFAIAGTPGGDERLGGVDFDQVVLNHVATTIGPGWQSLDVEDEEVATGLARVRENAVDAKEALSSDVEATIQVLLPGLSRNVRITRGELETAIRIPLLRTVDVLAQTLADARLTPQDVNAVLLVGGSSRIPLVSRLIASELGIPVTLDAHPKYAMCLGAAIAAGARLAPPSAPALPAATSAPGVPASSPPAVPAESVAPPRPAEPTAPYRPAEPALPFQPWVPPATFPPGVPAVPPATQAPYHGPGQPPDRRGTQLPAQASGPLPGQVSFEWAPPSTVPAAPAAAVYGSLRQFGITETVDTRVRTEATAPAWAPVLTAFDVPLTVVHTGDRSRGRRALVITIVAAALVVAGVTVGPRFLDRTPVAPPPVAAPPESVPRPAPPPVGGTATLADLPVDGAAGESLQAVIADGGGAVGVGGSSADGRPRAWRADGSGHFTPAQVADLGSALVGSMDSVTRSPARGELIAVGWVAPRGSAGTAAPAGRDRRAAVWTSPDGAAWTLRDSGSLGVGSATLGELYTVVADPAGGLVAAGVDWSADPQSGDGVILRSADGVAWQALPVSGLNGPGPANLRGLLLDGGGVVAVGSRADAGQTQAVVWTSPDAITWAEPTVLGHSGLGAAEATAAVRDPGGQLVVAGLRADLDGTPLPTLWSGAGPADLRPYSVEVPNAFVGGLAVAAGRLTAVGSRTVATGVAPAAWTITLPR